MAAPAFLFIGSLTTPTPYFRDAHGKGISVFAFDSDSGECRPMSVTDGIDNPTYLTFDPRRSCLYANSEVAGWNAGTVTAYRSDPATGSLSFINTQPTLGGIAAHNSLSRDGRFLLVANYGDDPVEEQDDQSIAVFPLRDDGGLDPACGTLVHRGSGPNQERQERPHAHCIIESPDGRFVIVADLGTDTVSCHRLGADGALTPDPDPFRLPPGSGPRQIAFHPSGRFACVINELNSTISALAYAGAGHLSLIETVSTIPAAASGENYPSELQFSRDGRFLYGSNRGHNSIANLRGRRRDRPSRAYRASALWRENTAQLRARLHRAMAAGREPELRLCRNLRDRSAERQALRHRRRVEVGTPMCVKFG